MNNKILGFFGLMGAPWLYLGMTAEEQFAALKGTWFTGAWELLYITGWICSIVALQRMKATGESRFGKGVLWVLLASLIIADISNVLLMIIQHHQPAWWYFLDAFWPISNLIMLVVGIVVVKANVLQGWKRFVPLVVGCWFPLAAGSMYLNKAFSWFLGGFYSAIAWSLLAIVIISLNKSVAKTEDVKTHPVAA